MEVKLSWLVAKISQCMKLLSTFSTSSSNKRHNVLYHLMTTVFLHYLRSLSMVQNVRPRQEDCPQPPHDNNCVHQKWLCDTLLDQQMLNVSVWLQSLQLWPVFQLSSPRNWDIFYRFYNIHFSLMDLIEASLLTSSITLYLTQCILYNQECNLIWHGSYKLKCNLVQYSFSIYL